MDFRTMANNDKNLPIARLGKCISV